MWRWKFVKSDSGFETTSFSFWFIFSL
jgi:hypothetical protein